MILFLPRATGRYIQIGSGTTPLYFQARKLRDAITRTIAVPCMGDFAMNQHMHRDFVLS